MEIHGWRTFAHPIFEKQLERLTRHVERLESREPKGYSAYPATKILATLNHYIREAIPRSLDDAGFQPEYTAGHWLQMRLHGRYRLFYRISRERRMIIYVCIANDRNAKAGPLGAFRAMLERL